MAQDIASLSFQVDPGNISQAVNQLNQLTDASKHVRASTQFMVTSVSSTASALTELASSGRASLQAFVSISQNLDVVTQKLDALRMAASRLQSGFSGNTLAMGLSSMQRNMSSMAEFFSTTSTAMEQFNRQAQYLHMNSAQTASALQRIGSAMAGVTPGGQALRHVLVSEGVNLNQSAAGVLRQFTQIQGRTRNSVGKLNAEEAIFGPMSPGMQTEMNYEPYRTVQQRLQFQMAQRFGQRSEKREMQTARENWHLQQGVRQYADTSKYVSSTMLDFGPSLGSAIGSEVGVGGAQGADIVRRILGGAARTSAVGEGRLGAFIMKLDKVRPGGGVAQNFLTNRGLENDVYQNTQFGRYLQFEGSSAYRADRNEIAYRRRLDEASGSIFTRLMAPTMQTTRDLSLLFGVNKGGAGSSDSIFNGYRPLALHAPQRGVNPAQLLVEQQAGASDAAQYFGDQSGNAFLAERQLGIDLSPNNAGAGSISSQVNALYGRREGMARMAQARAFHRYAANGMMTNGHLTPGFEGMQPLLAQAFVSNQGGGTASQQIENQGLAVAIEAYAKRHGLNPAAFMSATMGGGMASIDQILTGGGIQSGRGFTPGQRRAFVEQRNQASANFVSASNTAMRSSLAQINSAVPYASQGAGALALHQTFEQAYYAALPSTGTAGALQVARNAKAKQLALDNLQVIQTEHGIAFQGTEAAYGRASISAAGGALVGSRGLLATGYHTQLREQLAAQVQAHSSLQGNYGGQQQYLATARGAMEQRAMAGAQSVTAGASQSVQDAQSMLSITQQEIGSQDRLTNAFQAQVKYADLLAQAQRKGGEAAVQYVEQQIQKYAELKDKLDEIKALQQEQDQVDSLRTQTGINQALAAAPRSQLSRDRAFGRITSQIIGSRSPFLNTVPGEQAYGAPMPQSGGGMPPWLTAVLPNPATMTGSLPISVQAEGAPSVSGGAAALAAGAATVGTPIMSASGALIGAAAKAMAPYHAAIAASSKKNGVPANFLAWQAFQESSGNASAGVGTPHVGIAQMSVATGRRFGLVTAHHDYRTDPTKSIAAMAAYDKSLMGNRPGGWSNPANVEAVWGNHYGTYTGAPTQTASIATMSHAAAIESMTPAQKIAAGNKIGFTGKTVQQLAQFLQTRAQTGGALGIFAPLYAAAGAANRTQNTLQAQSASSMGAFATARAAAESSLLAKGRVGAASLAGASVKNPMYGSQQVQQAYASSAVASANAQNTMAFESASGQSNLQVAQGGLMVGAYGRGEGAGMRMTASISATNEGLQHNYTGAQVAARNLQILAQSLTEVSVATAKSNAALKVQASHQKELVHAAAQSPAALSLASRNIGPQEQIKQANEVLKRYGPNSVPGQAALQTIGANNQAMAANSVSQQNQFTLQNRSDMTRQGINMRARQFQMQLGPVASPMAQAVAQQQSQVYATLAAQGHIDANGQPTTAQGRQMMAQAAQAGQQQVLLEQQQQQQSAFNQIPQQFDSALTNSVFSFQHPSGQGLYMRYQLRSMLNNMGRSLFQASVGQPITNALTNNLGGFMGSLFGTQGTGNMGPTQGTGMGPGGGTSTASSALGGASSFFGSIAKGQLGKMAGSAISSLFAPLASGTGFGTGLDAVSGMGFGVGGAASAAPSFLSSIGSAISGLFANGGAFSEGKLMPYANGGIIDQPTKVPMAMMGEAGPEAILPLHRNSSGQLGVRMHGGNGGGGVNITVQAPITVAAGSHGQNGMDPQTMNAIHMQMKQTLTSSIRHVMIQESMPGGIIHSMKGG
ncbi:transglycosylase SLT domain-containing protein [Acidiphilium angustum]|uniref:transglycosylase SLT domain-containing protein n=1 Tax=Acidiphilium angustum TaxID=523 RepID=UPI000691418C|nr:transglycosylase SLT domain-containing protein [Acidiphilium angustum]